MLFNHIFGHIFQLHFSITLHARLTLLACECVQAPFNVCAYSCVQFKPYKKIAKFSIAILLFLIPSMAGTLQP